MPMSTASVPSGGRLVEQPPIVELRIDGRITPVSAAGFADALQARVRAGRPFLALFDRRTVGAPTAEGRAALEVLYAGWDRVAALVVAWADVYDVRRAASLERARQARAGRGEQGGGPSYPYRLFDDLHAAHGWLRAVQADPRAVDGAPRGVGVRRTVGADAT